MKVIIEIPKEFEIDCKSKFGDFWKRVKADVGDWYCGLYEREIIEMFREAFEKGEYIP